MAELGKNNVTVLSLDIDKKPPPNVHYIHMENVYDKLYGTSDGKEAPAMNLNELASMEQSTPEELTMYGDWCGLMCEGNIISIIRLLVMVFMRPLMRVSLLNILIIDFLYI